MSHGLEICKQFALQYKFKHQHLHNAFAECILYLKPLQDELISLFNRGNSILGEISDDHWDEFGVSPLSDKIPDAVDFLLNCEELELHKSIVLRIVPLVNGKESPRSKKPVTDLRIEFTDASTSLESAIENYLENFVNQNLHLDDDMENLSAITEHSITFPVRFLGSSGHEAFLEEVRNFKVVFDQTVQAAQEAREAEERAQKERIEKERARFEAIRKKEAAKAEQEAKRQRYENFLRLKQEFERPSGKLQAPL